jgi:hypothetical protein
LPLVIFILPPAFAVLPGVGVAIVTVPGVPEVVVPLEIVTAPDTPDVRPPVPDVKVIFPPEPTVPP